MSSKAHMRKNDIAIFGRKRGSEDWGLIQKDIKYDMYDKPPDWTTCLIGWQKAFPDMEFYLSDWDMRYPKPHHVILREQKALEDRLMRRLNEEMESARTVH